MSNRLLLKSSGTADAVPDFDDLELAELVINTRNGKMFCKTYDGATYAIVDLTLSSPDEIIASGPGILGRTASGTGPSALLSGADVVGLLPVATSSADGLMSEAQAAMLSALNTREQIGVVSADWSPSADTTYETISGLSFAVEANTTYLIDVQLLVYVFAGADFKIRIYPTAAAQNILVFVYIFAGITARIGNVLTESSAEATYDFSGNQAEKATLRGTITTNATTSGYINIQIAERVNGTAPTVYRGSFGILTKV